jgi:hypothetical protein
MTEETKPAASLNPLSGGRKWRAFLLLTAIVVLFVMTGKITDQAIIRDLLIGLSAVLAGGLWSDKKVQADVPKAAP